MATSMAAAIVASLPTAQVAPAAPQTVYEAIPPSMSKVIDVEAEIPVSSVQLDGLVVSKIIKHCYEAQPATAMGILLGIDIDGTLEISNCFPLSYSGDDEDKSSKALARYQASMLRSLKEVQSDDSVVGFYQSATTGGYFTQQLVDLQSIHSERLRNGGVAIVHDISQSSNGNAKFKALRLTKNFRDAYKKGKFNTQSLVDHQLTFSSILEEIPVRIRTNPLLSTFVNLMNQSSSSGTSTSSVPLSTPSHGSLELSPNQLGRSLSNVLEALDDYRTEEGNIAYLIRQIAREKARAEGHLARRRDENVQRVAQGLAPLPEDDVTRLFKTPPEPSRLESLLLLGQIDAYSHSLGTSSTTNLVKMFGANVGSGA